MSEFIVILIITMLYIYNSIFFNFRKESIMNTTLGSYPIHLRNSRPLHHLHHRFLRIFLFVFFILSSRSAMAAEPPNSSHPPSRTVSASPALRTSRARNSLRPQSDNGWYYADDSRHWYYQVTNQSTSLLTATPPSASPPDAQDSSPLLKTGWHHDVDGFTYYFDPSDGHMLAGSHTIDGIEYSFLLERDRGNYHQDSLGAWFYRANGLSPYGSLLFSRSRSDRHATPAATRPADKDRDQSLIDSEDLVIDRITIPPKASPSELIRDDETASPSELPREEDSTTTPSEIPREDDTPATPSEPPRSKDTPSATPDPESPDPGESPDPPSPSETPDPETPDPPAPPSGDRDHAHTSDPSVHCIATDDWSTILGNRDAYSDCIEHHCTALLYLSGPPVSWPLPLTDTTTQDYPLYVSLVDDRDGQLTFAQAYAIPELSDVPMYVGTSLHDSESTPTYKQSNLGGICDTWLFRTLVGTGTKSPFRFYLKKEDGTYSQHEFNYPGYQIRVPDADKKRGAALLPLQSTKKYISRGYQAETPRVEHNCYTTYLSDERKTESALPQLFTKRKMKSSPLWFPSTQELTEYTIVETETESTDESAARASQTNAGSSNSYTSQDANGDPLLSIYLKSERHIPALADSWRSNESYWLRSTPSVYLSEDTYDELGMSAAATRDEYFLKADSDGNIRAAHYDDTAAVRLIFTVK